MENESSKRQMITAAKKGDLESVRMLVARDRSLIDATDKHGSTPLHCAAWKGNARMVEELLELGANIDAQNENDHYGTTALHAAAHGNRAGVVAVLLAYGADRNVTNRQGRTPLEETAIHNATAAAKLLR
jgi:ankyrin repeat protein